MSGVAYSFEAPELAAALAQLGALGSVVQTHGADLTELAAAVAENAARRRIGEDKEAPDGTPWVGWSDAYGETRTPGQTILQSENHLLDSIAGITTAQTAEVGSNLPYARIHQLGGDTDQGHAPIPARPYLGMSRDDQMELRDDITTFLEGVL